MKVLTYVWLLVSAPLEGVDSNSRNIEVINSKNKILRL